MTLKNMRFKDQNWSHFGKGTKCENGEKREEEKRKKEESSQGMELTLGMNSCMNFQTIAWLFVVPKLRVC